MTKSNSSTPRRHTNLDGRDPSSYGSSPPPYSAASSQSSRTSGSRDRASFYQNNSGYGSLTSSHPRLISITSVETTRNVDVPKDEFGWLKAVLLATLCLAAGYVLCTCINAAAARELESRILDWNMGEVLRQVDLEHWKLEHERFEDDRRRFKEEEERRLKALTWDGLSGDHTCSRYGTRQYRATLSHTPLGLNECYKKPIEIHGKEVLPQYCDVQGPCGHVVGHWDVSFDEGSCTPWWSGIDDKGCDRGTRKHRYEAKLMNLHTYDNWEALCTSTPATIYGVTYEGATSCFSSIWGKYGVWLVDDSRCL
ncbi:hypothetical protein CPB83DRAFT_861400 [Crepidotus variabilis]|uniref:Uncharacterized protein n=1 Tax=Crepidotus variabilis TaxID=179855 RepID=A0A9P6E893_9AGAR|nr:hypothetical protein CPB83DRAFT_861400 [Crepidotus variabilis]